MDSIIGYKSILNKDFTFVISLYFIPSKIISVKTWRVSRYFSAFNWITIYTINKYIF